MSRPFRVLASGRILTLFLSEAALVIGCFAAAVFLSGREEFELFWVVEYGLARVAAAVASVLIAAYFVGLYDNIQETPRTLLVQQVCVVMGSAVLVQAGIQYVRNSWGLPRLVMLIATLSCLVLLPAWRMVYGGIILRRLAAERVLFVGSSATVEELTAHLEENPGLGFRCLGSVMPEDGEDSCCRVAGPLSRLRELVGELQPDRLVVGLSERRGILPVSDLLDLRFSGIRIEEVAALYESVFRRVCINELRPAQLVFSSELGPRRRSLQYQSIYSFAIAALGVLVALPVLFLVAIAVKLTSPGPVLFRQTRVGWQGVEFTLYKFRSMRDDAEAASGAVWAAENDPRITPLGRWLRRLRLDELPQLFNVLRGEMVIVGPRPERPEFVESLAAKVPFYIQRHSVKPGITGWAQINYGYGNTIADAVRKLEYDMFYIKNVSAWFDFYIMFHTARTMLTAQGAH
ncbi:MAG: sugar transferase [Acidobacteria bacterium]|nr:sugar transferase [Acidobacteriota bacterium]